MTQTSKQRAGAALERLRKTECLVRLRGKVNVAERFSPVKRWLDRPDRASQPWDRPPVEAAYTFLTGLERMILTAEEEGVADEAHFADLLEDAAPWAEKLAAASTEEFAKLVPAHGSGQ